MQFKRSITAIAAATLVGTLGFASASVLNLDGTTAQQGTSTVTGQEGTVETAWGYESDDNSVRYVRFSGFESDVVGDKAFVTVRDNLGAVIAKGSFTVSQTTNDRLTLPTTTQPQNIGSVEVALIG